MGGSGSVPDLPVVLCRKDGSDCYLAGLFCLVGYILWAGHRLGRSSSGPILFSWIYLADRAVMGCYAGLAISD
jgi:hypothetical protein